MGSACFLPIEPANPVITDSPTHQHSTSKLNILHPRGIVKNTSTPNTSQKRVHFPNLELGDLGKERSKFFIRAGRRAVLMSILPPPGVIKKTSTLNSVCFLDQEGGEDVPNALPEPCQGKCRTTESQAKLEERLRVIDSSEEPCDTADG